MTNPAPYIRQQLVSLLDGVIAYDGETVPVYENEGVMDGSQKYQILIRDQTGTADPNKDAFLTDFTTIVEVISETHSNVRKHVDIIGNEALALIKPTTKTTGIADSADWQITNLTINAPRYITEDSGARTKINRLILELNFKTTQKT